MASRQLLDDFKYFKKNVAQILTHPSMELTREFMETMGRVSSQGDSIDFLCLWNPYNLR